MDLVKLQNEIGEARVALAKSANGDLKLNYRQMIWRCMGLASFSQFHERILTATEMNNFVKPASFTNGGRRRTQLAVACATRVLPIWNEVSDSDLPTRALREIDLLTEQSALAEARAKYGRLFTACDNLSYSELGCATLVAYCSVSAFNTAVFDVPFDLRNVDPNVSDEDFDPYNFDSSCLAAAAVAGGFVWNEGTSSDLRREFWSWWCDEVERIAYTSSEVD